MAELLAELVAKITTDATGLKKGLSDAEGKTEASSKKMAESLKKVGIAMAASGAAITAALGLMGKAAIDEEINIKKLTVTLKNAGISYDDIKDSLEAVIATTQRKTGIADSEQRDILSRLVLITGDYNDSLSLLPDVLNLAAIGEMEANTAATYLGKAFMDLKGGATEVGVRFGQATVQFKDMAEIQTKLKGGAEALANPFSILKVTIGDVAEEIGTALVPTIKYLIDRVVAIAAEVKEWARDNPELTRTLVLVTGAVGGVLLVVGSLGLAIPPLVRGVKVLTLVFGAFKLVTLEYTIIALAAIAAIYGLFNLIRSIKGEAYIGTGIGDTVFGQIKRDIASLLEKARELIPQMAEVETSLDNTNRTGLNLAKTLDPNLVKAQDEAAKSARNLQEQQDRLGQQFADLMRQLQFAETEAGQLSLTMDDVYKAMYKLGYKTEEINNVFKRYGNITEIDERLLSELGLTANDVARIVGKLREETDKGTDSFKKQAEAIKQTADAHTSLAEKAIAAYAAIGGTTGAGREAAITAFQVGKSELQRELMAGGMETRAAALQAAVIAGAGKFAISTGPTGYQTLYPTAQGPPSYQQGGIVENTGLAYLHEGETVTPAGEVGGITIQFTQPVFFDREDTMNRFVDMIRKGIQRQDRLRFGGAYSG